jgi:hypothetical protein
VELPDRGSRAAGARGAAAPRRAPSRPRPPAATPIPALPAPGPPRPAPRPRSRGEPDRSAAHIGSGGRNCGRAGGRVGCRVGGRVKGEGCVGGRGMVGGWVSLRRRGGPRPAAWGTPGRRAGRSPRPRRRRGASTRSPAQEVHRKPPQGRGTPCGAPGCPRPAPPRPRPRPRP